MPSPTRAQLVLLEGAAASVAGGLVGKGGWVPAGIAGGVILVLLTLPLGGRWVYQVLALRLKMIFRGGRSRPRGVGDYEIVPLPGGVTAPDVAAVRSGTTWSVALDIRLDSIFNDDVPVPLAALAALLQVEEVTLASVRLLTLTSPARGNASRGAALPPALSASRYCVVTLDTITAIDAVLARGGSDAAIHQILRRCGVRAQEILTGAGLSVRLLDGAGIATLLARSLAGPPRRAGSPASAGPPASESWTDVAVAGSWSRSMSTSHATDESLYRLAAVSGTLPAQVVATAVELRPGVNGRTPRVSLVMRVTRAERNALRDVQRAVRNGGLHLSTPGGSQGDLFCTTTPIGVPA